MSLSNHSLKEAINQKASELGFVKTGFSNTEVLLNESEKLENWLDKGYDADMKWIEKGFEKRKDIFKILPEAKTIISFAYNYYTNDRPEYDKNPKISRYAWGKDYHIIIKEKLKILCEFIKASSQSSDIKTLYYVDDGPVMDKVWAVKSGIGWMGKHTNVINSEYGSWIFLSEIITNLEFDHYDSPVEDLCGSCSLCVDACPTGAIEEDYVVNSNKCISYQTIENKGEIPPNIDLSGWIYGCDICQDVCPFNSQPVLTTEKDFDMIEFLKVRSLMNLNSLDENSFKEVFMDSPIKRTKHSGWKRNLERFKN